VSREAGGPARSVGMRPGESTLEADPTVHPLRVRPGGRGVSREAGAPHDAGEKCTATPKARLWSRSLAWLSAAYGSRGPELARECHGADWDNDAGTRLLKRHCARKESAGADSDVFQLHRDMGCTRAEFMRWLPGATRQAPLEIDGDAVTITTHGGCVQINLEQKLPLRIGPMALPALGVTFHFSGLDGPTREDFLAYFDLYTRRGGG
jgi:hypothetical protein